MANIWNSISRQPSHSRKKEKELVVPGGSIKWSKSKTQNITAALKGGCTRFEVEYISCNLLLHIGKKE